MKKYTMADFASFEKNENGYVVCPPGDYTAIRAFPEWCSFGARCSFGEHSSFGDWCSFGEHSSFGKCCSFGACCSFGEWCKFSWHCTFSDCCRFSGGCRFGEGCKFSERCSFSEGCVFGEYCEFGWWCRFGVGCSLSDYCSCEQGHKFISLFQIGYIGSRNDTTQFWLLADSTILVRCGSFCGHIDEFVAKVEQTHGDNHYTEEYLAAVALAKLHFGVND